MGCAEQGDMIVVGFVTAAAVAAVARWQLTMRAPALGTLAVNVVGAWTLGLIDASGWGNPTILGTAGLGALTTVSGLASVTAILFRRGRAVGVGYLMLTVGLGTAAAWWGLNLG